MAEWPDSPVGIPLHDPIYSESTITDIYKGMDGVIYKGARILLQLFTAPEEVIRDLLPPVLNPGNMGIMGVLIAEYPETTLGPYKEAAILVECQFEEVAGLHVAYMYIDQMYGDHTLAADKALICGREIMGFPKTLANIELIENGNHFIGSVRRKGMEIIRVEADITDVGDFTDLGTMIQVRSLPTPDMKGYAYRDVCVTNLEYQPLCTWVGNGEVFFPPSADLVRNIRVDENLSTFYTIADFVIPRGKILKVL